MVRTGSLYEPELRYVPLIPDITILALPFLREASKIFAYLPRIFRTLKKQGDARYCQCSSRETEARTKGQVLGAATGAYEWE